MKITFVVELNTNFYNFEEEIESLKKKIEAKEVVYVSDLESDYGFDSAIIESVTVE